MISSERFWRWLKMINCPITKTDIDIGECVVIVDVCEKCIKKTMLPDEIKKKENWQDICRQCPYHNN